MNSTVLERMALALTKGDETQEMRFYSTFAQSELFLLLTKEADGDVIDPESFETEEGTFLLVFDRPEALAGFAGRPAPYAALTGRALAQMLSGQKIGIALNPGSDEAGFVMPPETVAWLAKSVGEPPQEASARPVEVTEPSDIPSAVLEALDTKAASMVGLARSAYLAGVRYENGTRSHILAFVDVEPLAERAIAAAVSEALTFSGLEAAALDVAFFDKSDPMAARLAKVGLHLELPEAERPLQMTGPGLDPDRPPRLV